MPAETFLLNLLVAGLSSVEKPAGALFAPMAIGVPTPFFLFSDPSGRLSGCVLINDLSGRLRDRVLISDPPGRLKGCVLKSI